MLQDEVIDLDDITLLKDSSIFNLIRSTVRPMENRPEIIAALSFEQNLDLFKISRTGYTVLDLLS